MALQRLAAGNEILQLDRLVFRSIRGASQWLSHTDEKGKYCDSNHNYTRSRAIRTPYLEKVSPQLDSPLIWTIKLFMTQIPNFKNHGLREGLRLSKLVFQKLDKNRVDPSRERARSISDYVKILVDDKEKIIPYLDYAKNVKTTVSDKALGDYRLAGPNPSAIRPTTFEDLKLLGEQKEQDKNLLDLIDKKRLYTVDYSMFAAMKPSKYKPEGLAKVNPGTIALFRQENSTLVPVCIKVIGNHSGDPEIKRSKIFYPNDPAYSWEIAKCAFSSNDFIHQTCFPHLAGGHLVAEVFLVATFRRLPTEHPINKLLSAHFFGTAHINDAIDNVLIREGAILYKIQAQEMPDMVQKVENYVEQVTGNDMRFPEKIKARKMDAANAPDLDYPYRDDGLLLWDAIYQWVDDYLRIYYPNDQAVATDICLRNWIDELKAKDGGNVKWLNGFDYTKKWLTDIVTSIIFVCSVEHASVNFAQLPFLQFTAAFPASLYSSSEEVLFKPNPIEQDYISLLPPISMAEYQTQLSHALSGFVLNPLGHYEQFASFLSQGHYFRGVYPGAGVFVPRNYLENVEISMRRFQGQLDSITKKINERNAKRQERHLIPYEILLPKNIPQSINT